MMSTHPNVILMCVITPDNLARKTMREIVQDNEEDIKIENIIIVFRGRK